MALDMSALAVPLQIENGHAIQFGNDNQFELLDVNINNNQTPLTLFANLVLKGDKLSLYKSAYNAEIFYVLSKEGKNYVLQNDKFIPSQSEIKNSPSFAFNISVNEIYSLS